MGCKGNYGKFQFNRKEKNTIEGGQTLGQVAKKQRGITILGDTPNLAGGGLGNLLKWGLRWAGGRTRRALAIPSSLHDSLLL